MDELLYHHTLGFPKDFVAPNKVVRVNYSSHAKREAVKDRYGILQLPKYVDLGLLEVIEVGMRNSAVSKIVFRGSLDETRDYCIVLIPNVPNQPWFAKTCWINLKSDKHKTLNMRRYETVD